jgi:hypothetical protein
MALVEGGKRTATVTVARRADLLAIDEPAAPRGFAAPERAR